MQSHDEPPVPPPGSPDQASLPPWRPDRRARSAPRLPLTRDAILDAALVVLERDGMEGLSMRRVADELGTGAASLYWYVRNKEELLQLLFERLNDEIRLPAPDPVHWQDQLMDLGRQVRAVARRHRDYARISLGRIPSGPSIARFSEWLFELMTPAGVPDRVIAYTGDLLALYVGAYAFEESLGLVSPAGDALPAEAIAAIYRDYLSSLPAERFPHVRRAAADLFAVDADDRFEFGLRLLIKGLESYARPTGSSAPHDAG